jgi:pilus assembly protein Flp/PilA
MAGRAVTKGRPNMAAILSQGLGAIRPLPIYLPFKPPAYALGMAKRILAFLKNESGATAIEYGLIAAGISIAIISVVQGLGSNLKKTFGTVSSALK